MSKQAISVSLENDNLLWLRGRALAAGRLSISETLDRLIRAARSGGQPSSTAPRSVVGTIKIAADDPDLRGADDAVRAFLACSGATARASQRTLGKRVRRGAPRHG